MPCSDTKFLILESFLHYRIRRGKEVSKSEVMIPDTPIYEQASEPYLIIVNNDTNDLENIREIYSGLKLEHRVIYLNTGEDLFDFLETKDDDQLPSLIILDYSMPQLNGSTILMMIREERRYNHIPVVIYTTSLTRELEKELLLLGATYCRKKRTNKEGLKKQMIEFISLTDISFDNMALLKR